MANNRRKGIRIEQVYAKYFRESGFTDCITSREGSKLYDDAGVDFLNMPVLIQCKAGYERGINYVKLLETLHIKKKKLPKYEQDKITCVLHIKDVGRGNKRKPEHNLVILTLDDFTKLLLCLTDQSKGTTNL